TIDPADAKDFDDALSYKPLDNGLIEVGVHIADVSYYVKPDTLIDKEAQARGTSVYLVDRTVPMLPEMLSNNLCSLRPGEDKLTFSAVFEMTPKGKVVNRWFGRTIICSDHRLDYDQAQVIIEKAASPSEDYKPEMLDTAISTLWGIAKILREKRFKLGAISFERPEMKVEVDATGKPLRVYQKISKEANWLIEEFMLLANRSVAEFVAAKGKTMVYRIHAEPNEQKIMDLKAFAKNFGYKMGDISNPKAVAGSLNELLDKAKGTPEHDALELLSLRAMSKAIYSTENIGHYGLAFPCYTHFTSPIRRYPDTMVHRLLGLYLDDAKNQNQEYYEKQCKHASEREALAADAERASVKYKLVEFMMDKIGQEFDGTVSGITEWGMYVEIAPTKIEGMVPLREIRSDFFEFDEKRYRLVGKRTHKVFLLGDPVRIRVKDANLEQKLLDYELVEEV
ncbi:MAG: VacB/RNase II family 3'-5' exoribonuclease, partial [Bacteroidales bacterium]|nr:VacB/RNase II family 3'-5' exoribonuclease [Bacteroidales bacterium]